MIRLAAYFEYAEVTVPFVAVACLIMSGRNPSNLISRIIGSSSTGRVGEPLSKKSSGKALLRMLESIVTLTFPAGYVNASRR